MSKITSKIKQIIESNLVALATVDYENRPNVIAVGCVKVVSENQIVITDNFMEETSENIKKNNWVCLAVWDKDENGYKINGDAEYYSSGEWLDFVKNLPENKSYPAKGAIVVDVLDIVELG